MTDLDQILTAPDARVSVAGSEATLASDGRERRVPLAALVGPLVAAHGERRIASGSVLDLAESALAALHAVAERQVVRDEATGRWQPTERHDETVVSLVDAFVAGPGIAEPGPDRHRPERDAAGEPLELTVTVADDGRAHLAPAAPPGDRRTNDLLRGAAASWLPIERLAARWWTELSETELTELLDPVLHASLAAAGLRVAWAAGVAAPDVALGLDEDDATTAHWQLRLPDGRLSPEEIAQLAASQRPLVRVRDVWVVNDPRQRERAGSRRSLDAGERAAALVTGGLVDGERLVPVVTTDATRRRAAELAAAPPPVKAPRALEASLRGYQLDGLAWLLRNAELGIGSCLADDMGLGKTVSAIAFHLALRERGVAGATLVVCPASVLGSWDRELRRFAPSQRLTRYHGPSRAIDPDADVVLTTYATARGDAEVLGATGWSLVVADEAQAMKNADAKTARAMRRIPAEHRLALSGTPIQNSLEDLWALIDWTTPGMLGSRRAFARHLAGPITQGHEAPRIRLAQLTGLVMLRRRKDDPSIAPELPAKTIGTQAVALTTEQIGLYQAVVEESLSSIAGLDEHARRGRVLALLTALKQICNHPAQYLKERDPQLEGRSEKLDALAELATVTAAEDSPMLVFTQYVAMGRLIRQRLREQGNAADLLHGGLDIAERQRLVDAFQRGELNTLVLSTHAGGTGLTLTRAEHVVHYDQWWNPAVEDQATDRAHRIGQTRPIQVHRLVCEGTLEERIDEILHGKRALSRSILDDAAALRLADLDDAALASLVTFNGAPA